MTLDSLGIVHPGLFVYSCDEAVRLQTFQSTRACITITVGHAPPSTFEAPRQAWCQSTSRLESFPEWRMSDLFCNTRACPWFDD